MYYPEAVYNLYITKKRQAEEKLKHKSESIETISVLEPETWDGVLKKYADRRFTG